MKKEILVSVEFQQKRVGLLEDGQLAEFYIEQEDDNRTSRICQYEL